MQWLPHTVKIQWIYLLYRAVVSFYFLVWLFATSINYSSPNILLFFTQWSFIFLNAYLLVALINTSINFILVHVYPKTKKVRSSPDNSNETAKRNCCRTSDDQITVCDKATWFLYLIGTQSALFTLFLFWALAANTDHNDEFSVTVNVHIHGLNGLVALIEVWLTGIPIRLLHFVYILLFAGTYGIFTGIHYGVNATGPTGERYIYPIILDYDSEPGLAAGTIVISGVVCILVHFFFYLLYLLRHWLTNRLQHHFKLYWRYFNPIDMSGPIPVLI